MGGGHSGIDKLKAEANSEKVLYDKVQKYANNIVGDYNEHAAAFDKDGNVIWEKEGEHSTVPMTNDDWDAIRQNGGVVCLHNHPDYKYGISAGPMTHGDILCAAYVRDVVVATKDYIFRFSWKDRTNWFNQKLAAAKQKKAIDDSVERYVKQWNEMHPNPPHTYEEGYTKYLEEREKFILQSYVNGRIKWLKNNAKKYGYTFSMKRRK